MPPSNPEKPENVARGLDIEHKVEGLVGWVRLKFNMVDGSKKLVVLELDDVVFLNSYLDGLVDQMKQEIKVRRDVMGT